MLRTGRRGRSDAVRAMRPVGSLVTSHSLVENGVVEQT
jgi:hypothetical protein